MKIRYTGPFARRRFEFADGRAYLVSPGDEIDVDDDIGDALCNLMAPKMWEPASSAPPRPAAMKERHKGKRGSETDRTGEGEES